MKKCLSNVGVGVGVGGGVGEEEYEIEQMEKRRQSSSPYVLISPEVRTTFCIDDALQIQIVSVSFPRNILDVLSF